MDMAAALRSYLLILSFAVLCSCASMRMSDRESDRSFREGRYEETISRLKQGLDKVGEGRDQLLYLLDLGLVLHTAGRYTESNQYFLQAEQIADIKDYTSLSNEGASLLTGENVRHYKGEDFEKVLINTYLAMNFSLMGNSESALVEARKVNRKLYLMVTEGKRKYKLNPYAYYLSGILYENQGNYDDAYIDYKRTLELMPGNAMVATSLWLMANLTDRDEDLSRWARESQRSKDELQFLLSHYRGQKSARTGELVVFYQNGLSPLKQPHPDWYRLPKYYPRRNPVTNAQVEVNGQMRGRTEIFFNIESTAMQNLDDKWSGLLAKKIAGILVKEATAQAVEKATDNQFLGFLTRLTLHASDQADLRSWALLPRDLQILRLTLAPGEHQVRLLPLGAPAAAHEKQVTIKAGQKTFLNFRYVP